MGRDDRAKAFLKAQKAGLIGMDETLAPRGAGAEVPFGTLVARGIALATEVLRRGFFGRMRWLFLGR